MGPNPKGASRKEGTCLCSPCFAGKEITLLMQTLNTLSTPEEKLAALCKKYAELVSASPSYTLPALGGWHIFNYPKLHYISSYGAE